LAASITFFSNFPTIALRTALEIRVAMIAYVEANPEHTSGGDGKVGDLNGTRIQLDELFISNALEEAI